MAFPGLELPGKSGSINESDGAGNGTVEIKAASFTLVMDNSKSIVQGGDTVISNSPNTGVIRVLNDDGAKSFELSKDGVSRFAKVKSGENRALLAQENVVKLFAKSSADDPAYRVEQSSGT